MVKLQPLAGIYIHIPFCHQACSYCNFHFSTSLARKQPMLDAIKKEISLRVQEIPAGVQIQSIYLGGGTPSLLQSSEIKELLQTIFETYPVHAEAEITLEANPEDIQPDTLEHWRQMGIGRLSVGLQSFEEDELKWMNRKHLPAQALTCIRDIREAGFSNYSLDLIYGSPFQTAERLNRALDILLEHEVPHLSCYALTVEKKTALEKNIRIGQSMAPNPDVQSDLFLQIMQRLGEAGYRHYEISNYCLPGMESRHNSAYWQGIPYLGFGPSAHSYNGVQTRSWNIANNSLYIQGIQLGEPVSTSEILTPLQIRNEYIMLSLRTDAGINLDQFQEKFGKADLKRIMTACDAFLKKGWIIENAGTLTLSDAGKLLADGIASDLFEDDMV